MIEIVDVDALYNRKTIHLIKYYAMKKSLIAIAVLAVLTASCGTSQKTAVQQQVEDAQVQQDAARERLRATPDKYARDEAKRLTKEGFRVAPGALPLEKQLDRSYTMEFDYDANNIPKWVVGNAQSIGGNYDGAKVQATTLAKQDLAGKIQSQVVSIIESTVGNTQMEKDDAATITQSVMANKEVIAQKIGRVMTTTEAYRKLPNGTTEVVVRVAYAWGSAMDAVKEAVKEDMAKKGKELHGQIDQMLNIQ